VAGPSTFNVVRITSSLNGSWIVTISLDRGPCPGEKWSDTKCAQAGSSLRRTTIQESHRLTNACHSGRQELRQVRGVTAESPRLDRSGTETAFRSKRYADVLAFVSILKRSVQTARPRRARCPVSWSLPPDGMIVGRRTGRVFSVMPSGYPTVRRRQDFPASVELLMGCIHPSIPAWCQHVEAIKLSKQIITRKVTGDFFTLKPISEDVQGIRLGCSLPDHGLGPLGG
jgi:hypothetical protein